MREKIAEIIKKAVGKDFPIEVSIPAHEKFGHYSTNAAMRLAHEEKKPPIEIAKDLAEKINFAAPKDFFAKVEAVQPGFVNMWLSEDYLRKSLAFVYKNKKTFGRSKVGKGKKIIVEHSSPNIAKPMHVGHLRNAILGDALANIYAELGYKVIRWNYIGDWGTQFGKLIAAYKWWGDRGQLEREPIKTMVELYVRFHEEVKTKPELESEGREEFRKLEAGDRENKKLWLWMKKESLKEFEAMYKTLGIKFDVWTGESFFEKNMGPIVAELLASGIAKKSEGAIVIPLDKYDLLPGLIQKSDGASLYLTRDIANLRYRIAKYKPAKILYVIGNEQTFQFEQLFAVANVLGLDKATELAHVKYGLVLDEGGKKFSTREGRIIAAEEIIDRAKDLAEKVVIKKRPELGAKTKMEISEAVGIGALKFFNLKEHRHTDIVFDWEKMLDTAGFSGPYLQYTYARLSSILRKAKRVGKFDLAHISSESELALVKKLMDFPDEIEKSAEQNGTNNLALYLYELANLANRFYETTPILSARGGSSSGGKDDLSKRNARLVLIDSARSVLAHGLGLLGIKTPEQI